MRQPLGSVEAQWLVLGVFEDESEPPAELRGTRRSRVVKRLIAEKDVTGSLGELTPFYDVAGFKARRLLLVGLGPRDRFDAGAAFSAGFAFSKRLSSKRRESVAVVLPPSNEPHNVASALIEGRDRRHPGPRAQEKRSEPARVRHAWPGYRAGDSRGATGRSRTSLRRAEIVGEAVNLARDLVNTPPGDKSPAHLCDRIEVDRLGRRSGGRGLG